MRRVQDAAPEDPDALPLGIEERDAREPTVPIALRNPGEAWERQLHEAAGERFDGSGGGQNFGCGRFRRSQKLGEEAALREQLMLDYFLDGAGARVRPPG